MEVRDVAERKKSKKNKREKEEKKKKDGDEENVAPMVRAKKRIRKSGNCKICGKHFKQAGYIGRHVRSKHLNLRPHPCDQCEYAAKSASDLKTHMVQHMSMRERVNDSYAKGDKQKALRLVFKRKK